MNRTLLDKARTMMLGTNLPKNLWNEAILAAVYLLNRSPTSALGNTTPAELWKPPSWHNDYDMGITALNAQAYVEEIPNTIDQLDGRSDREFWLKAVKTELEAYQKDGPGN
ncbi:hypothetical protein Trydic_g12583 [Trypoxylus dichotomus]